MVDTPMAADRQTATIYINPNLYSKLSPFEKKFWTYHEKGHIILNTSDEIQADNYAFDKMAGTQFRSLKQMIEAAENLLDSNCAYHQERIDNLYRRALEWDAMHPVVNKATTKQINAINTGYANLATILGTLITNNTEVAQSGVSSSNNSTYMMIVAVILILIIAKLLK